MAAVTTMTLLLLSITALFVLPCPSALLCCVFSLPQQYCVFSAFTMRISLPDILKNYLKSIIYAFRAGRLQTRRGGLTRIRVYSGPGLILIQKNRFKTIVCFGFVEIA